MSGAVSLDRWPAADRPRERLYAQGAAALGDAELVALILGHGQAGRSVVELARMVLEHPDPERAGLRHLAERSPEELMALPGIGRAKAAALAAAVELGRRLAGSRGLRPRLGRAQEVYRLLAPWLSTLRHEELWVLSLDRQHGLIARERVGQGGVDYAPGEPSQVFRAAVRAGAAAVVAVHNHPSGQAAPSAEDRALTRRLAQAGEILGIELLDHVIIGDGVYFSFREAGSLSLVGRTKGERA